MLSKTYAKYIQSLQHKKFRDAEDCFIAEGDKVVLELLRSDKFTCQALVGLESWLNAHESVIRKFYDGPLITAKDFELEKISALSTPNHVIGVFEKRLVGEMPVKDKLTLALDTIQDPGNLGTIIRIADWFGIHQIICSDNCVDQYNPKVVQSTMGSLGRVNIVYKKLYEWLQEAPVKIYAAALDGKKLTEIKGLTEGILIIGNESKGISDDILQLAHQKITIPKIGLAESLNAAVATGIILSHV